MPDYQFGPFVVDRARYHVLRDNELVELTPKLLDLLLHLLDNAGDLVTKEQLLETLWPQANVTDNALAQAVSELRQALGDDAATPQFIKTVARRGYRFIAAVSRVEAAGPAPRPQPAGATDDVAQAIAVLEFTNMSGDADAAWLSAGIAETVTSDLRALGRFRVVDRSRVAEAVRRTGGSFDAVASDLGAGLVVVGSYQRHGDRIRITARIADVQKGDAVADAKVDGLLADIFELQDDVVEQFSRQLGIVDPAAPREGGGDTASLQAYRAFIEGWLLLEALDTREIPRAIEKFEQAVGADPRYALAYTGLATALLAAYEETRSDNTPARSLLDKAIVHAREAVSLDDGLAEAHATLAFVLVSEWSTVEALQHARMAVAIEPGNWRHFFRLGHAAWGDERLRAADRALALYPDFAFAHFQRAMVHVARGSLREAETVLRQGAAVQDRQISRGDRYPALGLHWMLSLVRLAQDDVEEALRESEREHELALPHRLYGREYEMNSLLTRGACLLRLGGHADAIACFQKALALYPGHVQSALGLATAFRAAQSDGAAADALLLAARHLDMLGATRPIEAGLARGQMLALAGRVQEANAILCKVLDTAPPGFAGWTMPIEPLLFQVVRTKELAPALERLRRRT